MESKEKYLTPNTFWEAVIPGAGNVMITRVTDDKVFGRQIYNRGMCGAEAIEMKVTEWDKEGFLVSFKPEEAFKDVNDEIVDVSEESKGLGIFKLNNKGDVVSAKVLGEFTGSENYLKMDGEKAQFESGAIRYTKTGKGRYDLIPKTISDILIYAQEFYRASSGSVDTTKTDLMMFAYEADSEDIYDRFINIVINLVNYHYAPGEDIETVDGLIAKKTTYADFELGWARMLDDLAKHYEAGAEKYGVDNWKKGIPVIGGDRGGTFADSALRHLNQYCMGKVDEPHQISCIWNCVCGIWTLQEEERNKK